MWIPSMSSSWGVEQKESLVTGSLRLPVPVPLCVGVSVCGTGRTPRANGEEGGAEYVRVRGSAGRWTGLHTHPQPCTHVNAGAHTPFTHPCTLIHAPVQILVQAHIPHSHTPCTLIRAPMQTLVQAHTLHSPQHRHSQPAHT